MQGPCPECGTEATTYFGDIFTVKGPRIDNTVTCSNCKALINVNAERRSVSYLTHPTGCTVPRPGLLSRSLGYKESEATGGSDGRSLGA